ncbi:MAG: ATP-binding protein [Acidimicrobiia bacterium]|nr:MAG: ATP-binding protein [Acidimicrobiia bacterium]
MSRRSDSLRVRMVLSHFAVVFVGVITVLIATSLLAPAFIEDHVAVMEQIAGPEVGAAAIDDFETGVLTGFGQALFIAAILSTIAALVVGIIASNRLLRPIDGIRSATKRLASGAYTERIEPPPEAELAALAEDVNALARTLEETEQRRLRLISEVAHELRTPLATIKGYMEGLVDGVFPATDEVFAATGREAARLERLAADLSELSRVEEGALDLRFEPLDLGGVAREVAAHLGPQFEDKGVTLRVSDLPTLRVLADRDRMAQVFTNIIGNALSYTPKGGTVAIIGTATTDTVTVRVTDTGRGLDDHQLENVFDRFYRADRSAPGGAGIGLTIARSLVQAHRGTIDVSSAGPGRGATFTISLPATTA